MQPFKPESIVSQISDQREAFLSYNISRIRELLRYLSPGKVTLFQTIPFLLHINQPNFPGYIDDPRMPRGISKFHKSGFWKYALKYYNINDIDNGGRQDIKGVYLMGSSGTIGQTEYSDFDYWLIIEESSMDSEQLDWFKKKITQIEKWSLKNYEHQVKFFFIDINQIRKNNFSAIDAESSGSAQKTLLKEEFYRTFIFIAGQIPYWAVFPAELKNEEYERCMEAASLLPPETFRPDDYIDLGNLASVSKNECLGALLWQTYKARYDPVKSLIKGALIVHYCFFGSREQLLCDQVKRNYSKRQLDSYLLDPYTVIFMKVIQFFNAIKDEDGLALVKECILLRLMGYPFASMISENSPKQELMRRLSQAWSWSDKKLNYLKSYEEWPENRKLAHDEKIFKKLTYLYELVLRSRDKNEKPFDMPVSDIQMLTDQISIWFRKKRNKLPRCSNYIRAKSRELTILVNGEKNIKGTSVWKAYGKPKEGITSAKLLLSVPELLRLIGWFILNELIDNEKGNIHFQETACDVSAMKAKRLLHDTCDFFSETSTDTENPVTWDGLMVVLKGVSKNEYKTIETADLLVRNTWGEMYFESINLSSIENNLLKCYKLANVIWSYTKKVPGYDFKYRIHNLSVNSRYDASKNISEMTNKLREQNSLAETEGSESNEIAYSGEVKPLLDRFDR